MVRKGSEISQDIRKVIVDLYKNGHKVCNITKLLNLPYMTVSNIDKRFLCSGSTENKPRSGRPKVVTDRDYSQLERLFKVNRRDSLSDITPSFNENRNKKVSRLTVQYLLGKHGFHRRVARKRVIVKSVNRKKRLAWYLNKRKWTVNGQWDRVIFLDESHIVIGNDSRVYVWRNNGEGYRPDLIPAKSNRKFQVMIWGVFAGIGWDFKSSDRNY